MIRNRKSQAYALHHRALILDLHVRRTQAEPRLTRAEIRRLLFNSISIKGISRHLAWLREHGHLPPK